MSDEKSVVSETVNVSEIVNVDRASWRQSKALLKWLAASIGVSVDVDVEITAEDRTAASQEVASWGKESTSEKGGDGLAFYFAGARALAGLGVTKKTMAEAMDYASRTKGKGKSPQRAGEFTRRLGLPEGSWSYVGPAAAPKMAGIQGGWGSANMPIPMNHQQAPARMVQTTAPAVMFAGTSDLEAKLARYMAAGLSPAEIAKLIGG